MGLALVTATTLYVLGALVVCTLGPWLLALVGAVNVPIIYFSVQWWNTLHQGASVSLSSSTWKVCATSASSS